MPNQIQRSDLLVQTAFLGRVQCLVQKRLRKKNLPDFQSSTRISEIFSKMVSECGDEEVQLSQSLHGEHRLRPWGHDVLRLLCLLSNIAFSSLSCLCCWLQEWPMVFLTRIPTSLDLVVLLADSAFISTGTMDASAN